MPGGPLAGLGGEREHQEQVLLFSRDRAVQVVIREVMLSTLSATAQCSCILKS